MLRFLIGLLAGIVLAVLTLVIGVLFIARLSERPPTIRPGSALVLNLDGDIPERAPLDLPIPLLQAKAPLTVADYWRLLRRAENDARIKAVVLMPGQIATGWAKLQELHADLARVKAAGKPLAAYLRMPSARDYYLATAASRIHMSPEDMLDLKGLRAEVMFLRGTLDKLGVAVEIQHAGKYKDFGDMFTRSTMSPETREVLNSILDELYGHLIQTIAAGRNRKPEEVRSIMDEGPFLARQALDRGLVDSLLYEDQFFEELAKEAGVARLNRLSPRDYLRSVLSESSPGRNRVALILAEGTITRGAGGGLGQEAGIASEEFIRMLRQVREDKSIRAAVVRVDSPGGDAFASDEIWREMNLLNNSKPLVISMSDEAASGGYYIALTGAPVVAYPGTITGSIGVVYGKVYLRGLYGKLGITKELLTRGRFADIDSDYVPLSDAARQKLREGVDATYRAFVEKVASARNRKFEEVEPLAQGRVWLGSQAHARGLVDELGGLDRAFELVRERAKIPAQEPVTILVYPPKRSLLERLLEKPSALAAAPDWLERLLSRWPASSLGEGAYLKLMPYTIEIR